MSKINRFANSGRAMITKFYDEAMEATKRVEEDMKEKMFLAQMDRLIGDISKPNKRKNSETLLFCTSLKNLIMDQAKIVYHNPACFDLPEVNEMGPSFTVSAGESGAYSEAEPSVEEAVDHGDASDVEEAVDHGDASDVEEAVDHGAASDVEEAVDHGAASDVEEAVDHGDASDKEEAVDHGAFSEAEPVEETCVSIHAAEDTSETEFFSDAEQGEEVSSKRLKQTIE